MSKKITFYYGYILWEKFCTRFIINKLMMSIRTTKWIIIIHSFKTIIVNWWHALCLALKLKTTTTVVVWRHKPVLALNFSLFLQLSLYPFFFNNSLIVVLSIVPCHLFRYSPRLIGTTMFPVLCSLLSTVAEFKVQISNICVFFSLLYSG